MPPGDAELTADCLLAADLEGHGSHGLSRLPFAAQRLRDGLIEARPDIRVLRDLPAAALLDAGNGLGPVAGSRAVDLACAKAGAAGAGICAVLNANHLGAVGWYARRAAGRGLIGLCFSNTPPAVAPVGGRLPYLGTNPIAAAFPSTGDPVVIDLATSQVARGRLLEAARAGAAIPEGWAFDADGLPTTDPTAGINGTLAPLGGPKGFALALLVEGLSGVLAGAAVGPAVGGTYLASDRVSNVGQSFWAIDPELVQPGFQERMGNLVAEMRAMPKVHAAERLRLPGDRARETRLRAEREGIELPEGLVAELDRLAVSAGAAQVPGRREG